MKKSRATSQRRGGLDVALLPTSEEDIDCSSIENNTNLNWQTGAAFGHKRQRVDEEMTFLNSPLQTISVHGDGVACEEVPAQQFYQSSHFFIDQLKDDFCRPVEDGWVQFKEAEEVESEVKTKTKDSEGESKSKKSWTKEEHQKFLEGLRLYGKNWLKITAHIGTGRSAQQVTSHGQKFMVKLVKFLAGKEVISEMTREQAEYFHGVLNKKTHWCTRDRLKKEADRKELKASGAIFEITKVARRQPKEPVADQASSYHIWKKEAVGCDDSYHQSLGFSIKIQSAMNKSDRQPLTFKAEFKYITEDDAMSDDSAASQSAKHKRVYSIDGQKSTQKEDKYFFDFAERFRAGYANLPDLSPDQMKKQVRLMIKLNNGVEFEMYKPQPAVALFEMSHVNDSSPYCECLAQRPNLWKYVQGRFDQYMDEHGLEQDQEIDNPMSDYFTKVSREEMDKILEAGLVVYYKIEDDEEMQDVA